MVLSRQIKFGRKEGGYLYAAVIVYFLDTNFR